MAAATGATLQGLERGLAVIQSFSHEAPAIARPFMEDLSAAT